MVGKRKGSRHHLECGHSKGAGGGPCAYHEKVTRWKSRLAQYFPVLRPAQLRGLALWVYGAVLAQSACQTAVVSALLAVGGFPPGRQYLREGWYDGGEKAAPCSVQVEVAQCFVPLLRWLLAWWQGRE